VVTIDSMGAVFSQDPTTGCVVNGNVSTINLSYNAYRVPYTYGNCTGQYAVLNGLQFSGLGTLDNTQTPEHLLVGASAQSGSAKMALVLNLARISGGCRTGKPSSTAKDAMHLDLRVAAALG
jgi:hypothetical protein